jgi:phenylalanyl-tRNA synthetase beta chain
VRRRAAACWPPGHGEAITWSFIQRRTARFRRGADALELANPDLERDVSMRPSLLPACCAVQRNRNRGFADLALFEVGQIYRGDARRTIHRRLAACARARGADGRGRHWAGHAKRPRMLDAKADAFALLASLGFDAARAQLTRDAPAWFHPGRSASVRLGPKVVLAQFGELHPETLRMLGLAGPVTAFEVFVDAIPTERKKGLARPAFAAADLLPVRRDFAFVVDSDVAAGDVIKAALSVDKELIAGAGIFDLFEGAGLGEGKKIARPGGDDPADCQDAHRSRDRGDRRQGGRGGEQGNRRRDPLIAFCRPGLSTAQSRDPRPHDHRCLAGSRMFRFAKFRDDNYRAVRAGPCR